MISRWLQTFLKLIAKALCLEYPVKDEKGNIIGYEYYSIRGGRTFVTSKLGEEKDIFDETANHFDEANQ